MRGRGQSAEGVGEWASELVHGEVVQAGARGYKTLVPLCSSVTQSSLCSRKKRGVRAPKNHLCPSLSEFFLNFFLLSLVSSSDGDRESPEECGEGLAVPTIGIRATWR